MNNDNFVININEVNNLEDSFLIGDEIFRSNKNVFKELKYKNRYIYLVFNGIVKTINKIPRSKLFVSINDEDYKKFEFLLKKINFSTSNNIICKDYLYEGKNKFVITRLPGYYKNEQEIIFTKFYKYEENNFEEIKIVNVSNSFEATFTIKIRGICINSYNNSKELTLITDLHEVVIINTLNKSSLPLSSKYIIKN